MTIGEGSYCVIKERSYDTVCKLYRPTSSLNTFIEHYIHTQVPKYKYLIRATIADENGYVLPRFNHCGYRRLSCTRDKLFQYGIQCICAVEYLHRLGFVHGDISLGNLLFNNEHMVLCDFNMSEFMGVPNQTVIGERSYINYCRHYRNTTNGELNAETDWYATAIVLTELWGQKLMTETKQYRNYRKLLGIAPDKIIRTSASRRVGLDGHVDDDAKEAITSAMFFSDETLRQNYYRELNLEHREVEIVERLFNYQPNDDVLSMLGSIPEPLPDLTNHRKSILYQTPPENMEQRVEFYREIYRKSVIDELNMDYGEVVVASLVLDRWYTKNKTLYLDKYRVNDLLNLRVVERVRKITRNNIYGRL